MILIGQYDSSFVRRVGIALRLYGLAFEHRPWSVFGDVERLRAYNPLTRVPTLVLDDGEVLIDTFAILDHLDGLVPARKALIARRGPTRRHGLKIAALATGLADKAVGLFYEQHLHDVRSDIWVARCHAQLTGTVEALEAIRAAASERYFLGSRLGHADIAVACALRHTIDSHPDIIDLAMHPALHRHCAMLEAMPVFQDISQAFIPPT